MRGISVKPGHILDGRYEIKRRIGQGRMGVTFSAYDEKRDKDIALKILAPSLFVDERAKEQFLFESKACYELYHPNIANVVDVKSDGEYVFLTMELLKGNSLRPIMDSRKKTHQTFSLKEVVKIAMSVLDALDYAHRKTVHLNIRPENIFVARSAGFKVMDFGLASLMTAEHLSEPEVACYKAPEQRKADRKVDGRADQYALGVMMYEMMTGEPPKKQIKSVRNLRKKYGRNLSNIVARMLAPKPGSRFDSVDEIRRALQPKENTISIPKINLKYFGIVVILMALIAGGVVLSDGKLDKLWQNIYAVVSGQRQQQIDQTIQLEGDILDLAKQLATTRTDRQVSIKITGSNIQILENSIKQARYVSEQNKLVKQLEPMLIDHSTEVRLQNLIDRCVFNNADWTSFGSQLEHALSLSREKRYLEAITNLESIKLNLIESLKQYDIGRQYFLSVESFRVARQKWLKFNQSQSLGVSPDMAVREKHKFVRDGNLSSRHQLSEAHNLVEQFIQAYEIDYQTSQQRVHDRETHQKQTVLTLRQENIWRDYIKLNGLSASMRQNTKIRQIADLEQKQLRQQDFDLANHSSVSLQEVFKKHLITAQNDIRDRVQKLSAEEASRRKKRQENEAKQRKSQYLESIAAGKTAMAVEAYDEALGYYSLALALKPGDIEATKLQKQAIQHKRDFQLELAAIEAKKREVGYLKAMTAGEGSLAQTAYDSAIGHFNKALSLKPNDRDAKAKRQIAAQFKLDIQRELAAAEARKRAQHYQDLMQEGQEALVQKDYQMAMSQFQKALEFKPKDISAIEKYRFALSQTPAELLIKYAPGLEIVEIKAGVFRMGDLSGRDNKLEMPVRQVQIPAFSLTKHEITFEQYDLYTEDSGRTKPNDEGWGRGKLPVININWNDANDYAEWLSQRTGQQFRLPSEAEWEYAARSGTTTNFSWGDNASHNYSNYGTDECCDGVTEGFDEWINTSPVGSFSANQFNLHDLHGNVWEWVQDCWNDSYVDAPLDSKARLTGNCKLHVVRGGSWFNGPKRGLEARWRRSETGQYNYLGFRLAKDR